MTKSIPEKINETRQQIGLLTFGRWRDDPARRAEISRMYDLLLDQVKHAPKELTYRFDSVRDGYADRAQLGSYSQQLEGISSTCFLAGNGLYYSLYTRPYRDEENRIEHFSQLGQIVTHHRIGNSPKPFTAHDTFGNILAAINHMIIQVSTTGELTWLYRTTVLKRPSTVTKGGLTSLPARRHLACIKMNASEIEQRVKQNQQIRATTRLYNSPNQADAEVTVEAGDLLIQNGTIIQL